MRNSTRSSTWNHAYDTLETFHDRSFQKTMNEICFCMLHFEAPTPSRCTWNNLCSPTEIGLRMLCDFPKYGKLLNSEEVSTSFPNLQGVKRSVLFLSELTTHLGISRVHCLSCFLLRGMLRSAMFCCDSGAHEWSMSKRDKELDNGANFRVEIGDPTPSCLPTELSTRRFLKRFWTRDFNLHCRPKHFHYSFFERGRSQSRSGLASLKARNNLGPDVRLNTYQL